MSTLAAQALALDNAADSNFYLKTLEEIIGQKTNFPITLKTDSRNLYGTVHSTKPLEDRRLKIDICSSRQKLANKEIYVMEWISKDFQLPYSIRSTYLQANWGALGQSSNQEDIQDFVNMFMLEEKKKINTSILYYISFYIHEFSSI